MPLTPPTPPKGGAGVYSCPSVLPAAHLIQSAPIALDASSRSNADTAIFLKFAAIGAFVTTILFWIGRVLLRVYMSDRHHLSDAKERVAIVMTYLALSKKVKLSRLTGLLYWRPSYELHQMASKRMTVPMHL